VQIHGPSGSFSEIPVHLNPSGFAVLSFGAADVFAHTPADCDEIIKAAALAKSMLPGETSEPVTADPGQRGLVGRMVADAHDDSPCPAIGMVVTQIDEETLEVLWDGEDRPRREAFDELRPVDDLTRTAQDDAGRAIAADLDALQEATDLADGWVGPVTDDDLTGGES
jgi:hypothetical protein